MFKNKKILIGLVVAVLLGVLAGGPAEGKKKAGSVRIDDFLDGIQVKGGLTVEEDLNGTDVGAQFHITLKDEVRTLRARGIFITVSGVTVANVGDAQFDGFRDFDVGIAFWNLAKEKLLDAGDELAEKHGLSPDAVDKAVRRATGIIRIIKDKVCEDPIKC